MLVWWLFTGDSRRGKVASRNHYLLHKSQNWLQKTQFALIKGKINTGLSICSPIICHFIMNDWSTKKKPRQGFFLPDLDTMEMLEVLETSRWAAQSRMGRAREQDGESWQFEESNFGGANKVNTRCLWVTVCTLVATVATGHHHDFTRGADIRCSFFVHRRL